MADYTIQSLVKAAQVLKVLANAPRPVALTEIALTVKLSKNGVFRILKTLEEVGFAGCAKEKWFIGQALIDLADKNMRHLRDRLEQTIRREMQNGKQTGQATPEASRT